MELPGNRRNGDQAIVSVKRNSSGIFARLSGRLAIDSFPKEVERSTSAVVRAEVVSNRPGNFRLMCFRLRLRNLIGHVRRALWRELVQFMNYDLEFLRFV